MGRMTVEKNLGNQKDKPDLKSLLIATDAWHPQVNGVVRTYDTLAHHLKKQGVEVHIIEPSLFYTVPMPGYSEIRLSLVFSAQLAPLVDKIKPDHIHIATEGPIGIAMRRYCIRNTIPFTTAFHTKFPEYLEARTLIPSDLSYYFIRQFHEASSGVIVSTNSLKKSLESKGFKNLYLWPKAVDLELFRPKREQKTRVLDQILAFSEQKMASSDPNLDVSKNPPIFLYVGRVAIEKNLEAFLDLDLPGLKIVVGEGPLKEELEKKYPTVYFVGAKTGEELADWYNSADVFVFPSLTDTYGNVILEALACGVPVAAFPVTGPIDIIDNNTTGCLNWDLKQAIQDALKLDKKVCRASAEKNSWEKVTQAFLDILKKVKQ